MRRSINCLCAWLLLSAAAPFCAAEVECDQTFGEVKDGVETVRIRGAVRYADDTPAGRNAAREQAVNDALNMAIIGRLRAEETISNFVLVKHFIEIQRGGFVPHYRVLKESFEPEKNGFLASVCVEAAVRSTAFELAKDFLKSRPALALAVAESEIHKSAAAAFMDGLYARLRDKYGSGITLPPRREGDSGIYKTPGEAAAAYAGKADFLMVISGLEPLDRAGKSVGLAAASLAFYTLGRGPAEELPLSAPGETKTYSGTDVLSGRKKITGEMQDWCLANIDSFIRRTMSDADKVITFPEPLSFEQFSAFAAILEKAAAAMDTETWGKPEITPKQDKNYFRVQWRGTSFELARALAAQLNGEAQKFKVEKTNFQSVLVGIAPVAKEDTANETAIKN